MLNSFHNGACTSASCFKNTVLAKLCKFLIKINFNFHSNKASYFQDDVLDQY